MKKINLLGYLSMALIFLFVSCSDDSSLIVNDKTSIYNNEDCGECEGQITSLDLEYLGNMVNATIDIYEGKVEPDKLFKTFSNVNTGDVISFVGSKKNDKMGSKIFLTVNGNNPQEIHTSCSQDIYAGMTFGDYLIIAGTSHEGGPLCAKEVPGDGEDCGECEGQITSLDLEYLGSMVDATIDIYEGKVEPDKLFKSFSNVNTGDLLSFVGSKKDNKMGSKIFLTVNGNNPQEIHTSCSQDIYAGMTFGDYLIIAGTSHEGGPLCAKEVPGDGEDCGECEGQITSLDLEYLGSMVDATIDIYEGKVEPDKLFKSFSNVNTGDLLSFVGSKKDNKMGSKIFLTVNGNNPVEIHTSCSQPIYVGMEVAGQYLILAGTSHEGGNLPDANGDCSEVEEVCMDAFAYKNEQYAFCFLDYGFDKWGWTNKFTFEELSNYQIQYGGNYQFPLYAGAVDCDLSLANQIGYIELEVFLGENDELKVNVKYVLTSSDYSLSDLDLYLADQYLFPFDNLGNSTIDTDYYTYHQNEDGTSEYVFNGLDWPSRYNHRVYVIAYATVCSN